MPAPSQPIDHYHILGVEPLASTEDIRKAYKALVRRFHPDVNRDPSAVARMVRINQAAEVLLDTSARTAYDIWRARGATRPEQSATPGNEPRPYASPNQATGRLGASSPQPGHSATSHRRLLAFGSLGLLTAVALVITLVTLAGATPNSTTTNAPADSGAAAASGLPAPGAVTQIDVSTLPPLVDSPPVWQPDGQELLIHCSDGADYFEAYAVAIGVVNASIRADAVAYDPAAPADQPVLAAFRQGAQPELQFMAVPTTSLASTYVLSASPVARPPWLPVRPAPTLSWNADGDSLAVAWRGGVTLVHLAGPPHPGSDITATAHPLPLPAGAYARSATWLPRGLLLVEWESLATGARPDYTLAVVDQTGANSVAYVSPQPPGRLSVSPDGQTVVLSLGVGALGEVDLGSGLVTPLAISDAWSAAWSTTGDSLAIVRRAQGSKASALLLAPSSLGSSRGAVRTVMTIGAPREFLSPSWDPAADTVALLISAGPERLPVGVRLVLMPAAGT